MSEEKLTIKQLAEVYPLSVSTIRNYIKHKNLPHFKIGAKYYFYLSEIKKFFGDNLEERNTGGKWPPAK